jgi:hypothetical protein
MSADSRIRKFRIQISNIDMRIVPGPASRAVVIKHVYASPGLQSTVKRSLVYRSQQTTEYTAKWTCLSKQLIPLHKPQQTAPFAAQDTANSSDCYASDSKRLCPLQKSQQTSSVHYRRRSKPCHQK